MGEDRGGGVNGNDRNVPPLTPALSHGGEREIEEGVYK